MSKDFSDSTFLFGANAVFIEELYAKYLQDPSSVDKSWVDFFVSQADFVSAKTLAKVISAEINHEKPLKELDIALSDGPSINEYSLKAKFMIKAYRERGHYLANLDPLSLEKLKTKEELKLNLSDFGFENEDLAKKIDITGEFGDLETASLQELVDILDKTYSGAVAFEVSHIENMEEQKWLYNMFENMNVHDDRSNEAKKSTLQDLVEIEGFEQYLHTKFPGAKRFSVEGGDAAVIAINAMIDYSARQGTEDVVIGMAHRGRLSTLTKVMEKPYVAVFSEFMGNSAFPTELDVAGDVKYHMGYSSDKKTSSGKDVHLSLVPNPSHLEAVNPVVAGKVRAKQDDVGGDRNKIIGILIHGDAAFCGQGVVAEGLVMSGLAPYNVGGILHLIINNQIGFTANPYDTRPGRYCTEVAKMAGAPIFHVNGDDVESVILATKIATEYRRKFGRDVVLDVVCYRKYGHNEGDEPMYTQSVMYKVIKAKQTPAAIYAEKLVAAGVIQQDFYSNLKQAFKKQLDEDFNKIESYKPRAQWLEGHWSGFDRINDHKIATGVAKIELVKIGTKLCNIPDSFALNPKLAKLFQVRKETLENNGSIDWATAEQLAFATLLRDKIAIRMTGQDVERGTFSHRHAVLHSQEKDEVYLPLNNISEDQAKLEIADSNLSEYGVLGFEYGYSTVNPNHLVIWEAQFGDFVNGAQIIIDQFISSAETKWLRMSGLVVLLPHGMEGQGPEHSSARLERFLQLCAENNMYITYPTSPASIFHLFRLQMKRNFRKPLIVMSPKSLLRHKLAVSNLSELDDGSNFIPVIDEIDDKIKVNEVLKVVFCTGKIYYDLLEARNDLKKTDTVLIRLEQLYPFAEDEVVKIILKYKKAKEFVWCQEEPFNMGAWKFIRPMLDEALAKAGVKNFIKYVGRERSSSPAVGYLYIHNKEQKNLANKLFK